MGLAITLSVSSLNPCRAQADSQTGVQAGSQTGVAENLERIHVVPDVLLTLGAGDIDRLVPDLTRIMQRHAS